MKAINRLFLANSIVGHVKQAYSSDLFTAGARDAANKIPGWVAPTADIAANLFVPGYTTVSSGVRAVNSARQGDWWGAAGNGVMAGLGLLPGWGAAYKLLGKPIARLGSWGAKGLSPTLYRAGSGLDKVWSGLKDKIPYGKALGQMRTLPAAALDVGGSFGLAMPMIGHGQENMAERAVDPAQASNFMPNFRNFAQSNIVQNPMYAQPYHSMGDTAQQVGDWAKTTLGRMV